MCDICVPILGRAAPKAHGQTLCPLAKTLYCGRCASYGHSPKRCVRRSTSWLADSNAEDTLYPCVVPTDERIYEVANEEGCIKAALMANDGIPMICQEKGKRELKEYTENRARLTELVKSAGYTLVLRGEGPTKNDTLKQK